MSALYPIATFSLPVVFCLKVNEPIAVLNEPVLFCNADVPIAALSDPDVFESSEPDPRAILLFPVTLLSKAA